MREDRQTIMLTHLSQLLNGISGLGGFIVPLIIWLINKDKIYDMDEEGKSILNFQITLFVYGLICVPLIFLLGIGIIGLIIIGIASLVFPIINAIKVTKDEPTNYPYTIQFIK